MKSQLEEVTRQIKEEFKNLRIEMMFWIKHQIKTELEQSIVTSVSKMLVDIEKLRDENFALRKTVKDKDAETMRELSMVRKQTVRTSPKDTIPSLGSCAFQLSWEIANATITYDSLLSDWSNEAGEGIMDINTGVYTLLRPGGFYRVTYSGFIGMNPGDQVYVDLHHNGERVKGGDWYSQAQGDSTWIMSEQGSRSLVIHMDMGDTLELKTREEPNFGHLLELILCVSLTAPESVP